MIFEKLRSLLVIVPLLFQLVPAIASATPQEQDDFNLLINLIDIADFTGVQELIEKDKSLLCQKQDGTGYSALQFAVLKGNFECVEYFLSQNPSLIDETTDQDQTLMDLAEERDHFEISFYLSQLDETQNDDFIYQSSEFEPQRLNPEERPYPCAWLDCGKKFKQAVHLKTHELTHTGDRPYACEFEGCEKKFTTSGNLKNHERLHTGEKPYVCEFELEDTVCGKRFARSGALEVHERTHSEERRYVCNWNDCGSAFKQLGHLSTHKLIHTGERPFVCDFTFLGKVCGKGFVNSGALKVHSRIHTGERPFLCNWIGCSKNFLSSSDLRVHKRSHTREKPYPCRKCGKAFSQSGHRSRHERTCNN